jgi:hypothetical protein
MFLYVFFKLPLNRRGRDRMVVGFISLRGRYGRDRMVVGFTTTYVSSAYHH